VYVVAASFQTTVTSYGYVETGVNITGRKSLILQVQGIDNAVVAIVTTPGNYTDKMFEVGFRSIPDKFTMLR